jgi:hypothetical protein
MQRLSVLALGLTLGLGASVVACDSGEEEDTGPSRMCGEEWPDVEKDPNVESIMDDWGLPCMSDADCVDAIGPDAACVTNILGVYDLPGGYCSKLSCELPNSQTTFVLDAADCSADGGIACVGVAGVYTVCAEPCTSDSECGRVGYACTVMPNIGAEGDPTFCLMNAADCCTTDSGECAG